MMLKPVNRDECFSVLYVHGTGNEIHVDTHSKSVIHLHTRTFTFISDITRHISFIIQLTFKRSTQKMPNYKY